ncbi:MAG: hypothetical protein PVG22_05250 [Chromatiales bacterium]|jgi:hypothetical protein
MTIPFDMKRLHHGCGESLQIKPCMLCRLGRQAGEKRRAGLGLLLEQAAAWEANQNRESVERLWG